MGSGQTSSKHKPADSRATGCKLEYQPHISPCWHRPLRTGQSRPESCLGVPHQGMKPASQPLRGGVGGQSPRIAQQASTDTAALGATGLQP